MSQRIEQKFAELKGSNKKALITFIMGGDPDLQKSAEILARLPKAGADIIEIGMPFSDPMADGATIEAAGLRSLAGGTKLKHIIAMVEHFRKTDSTTPIILMGYYNPIHHYGVEKFCADSSNAGVDGVILVDLPPEEEKEFTVHANKTGLKLIRLIAPTTDDKRLALLLPEAGGFLYYVSITGITGTKSANMESLAAKVANLKSHTKLPVAVGFGIKTPENAAAVAKFADAVVVGSALVEIIANQTVAAAMEFVAVLRKAMDSAA
jgi:tryptophan synthase alpha chain